MRLAWLVWSVVVAGLGLAASAFEGVHEARVRVMNGVPCLFINGVPTPPVLFFSNPEQCPDYLAKYQRPQVKLAAQAGVHLYSFPIQAPELSATGPVYTRIEQRLQSFVADDPEALLILRIWPPPWQGWAEYARATEADFITHADQTRSTSVTLASDLFWEPANAVLAALIRHLEAGPYGRHILAYHVGGPVSELFPEGYREQGPDISGANTARFRAWLRAHYGGDAALAAAWGQAGVTLATAAVPRGEPGRFPMHQERAGEPVRMLYALPAERDWVDYGEFTSDITADRVLDWARLIKRETRGRKLVVFFFGYSFELVGSFNGHGGLMRVLECPDVDVLVGPLSYTERTAGEPAGFMAPVDSVTGHGKLWLNEDDTRTHCVNESDVPAWLKDSMFGSRSKSLKETLNLLDRNLGALVAHRAGTWWMDLGGCGAFSDPPLWDLLKTRLPLLRETLAAPAPYPPEVAVLVHDASKLVVRSDWTGFYQTLMDFRNQCAKSGAAVGWYTLEDFLAGRVPPCKAYLFPNAFFLTEAQIEALRQRLREQRCLAVWAYAPGCVGPAGFAAGRAASLTGIAIEERAGRQQRTGEGLLAGESWGPDVELVPRLVVNDAQATPLARFASDATVAVAEGRIGECRSVYLGGIGVTWRVLGRLLDRAGVHRWTRGGEIIQTDGRTLMVHTGHAGPLDVSLPPGTRAEAIQAIVTGQQNAHVTVSCEAGDTLWLRLQRE
jgi:hypothetical protein